MTAPGEGSLTEDVPFEGQMDEESSDEEFSDEDYEDVPVGLLAAGAAALFFFTMFGFWDILFIIVACSAAYKVGTGGQWWDDD
ncbi:MAG: hypothetical protein ABIP48_10035 [Planctomycetota bacterium]